MSYQDQIHLYAERCLQAIDDEFIRKIGELGTILNREGEMHNNDKAIQFNFHQNVMIGCEAFDKLMNLFPNFEVNSYEYEKTYWIEAKRKDDDGFETRIVVFC